MIASLELVEFQAPKADLRVDLERKLCSMRYTEQAELWRDIVNRLLPAQRAILEEELNRRSSYYDRA